MILHDQESVKRLSDMLTTALGQNIGGFLTEQEIIEVMVNPDGCLWVDKLVPVLKAHFWSISAEREIAKMLFYLGKLRFLLFPFCRPRLKIELSGQELVKM